MTTLSTSPSTSTLNGGQLALLNRVAYDDAFRAELEANPQAALAQLGLDVDPSVIPDKVTLPSEEAMASHLSCDEADSWYNKLRHWIGFLGN
ncbi:MAG: NHLP-related RiPP peptide [Acidobacteriota bacterium]